MKQIERKASILINRFETITDQSIGEWSGWEKLKDRRLDTDPHHVAKCVVDCCMGELSQVNYLDFHVEVEPAYVIALADLMRDAMSLEAATTARVSS